MGYHFGLRNTLTKGKYMTLVEIVARHLIQRGSITRVTAMAEYGHMHLGDVILKLRTNKSALLPVGSTVETVRKTAVNGRAYSEYVLKR
jgi:hypothetical protein